MFSGEAFAVLVYPLLAGVALGAFVKGKTNRPKVVCMALFGVYLVGVLRVTLFPIPVDGLMARDFASIPFMSFANFVPIVPLLDMGVGPSQLANNVVLGVPFGFGAWFVIRRPTLHRVLGLGVTKNWAPSSMRLRNCHSLNRVGIPTSKSGSTAWSRVRCSTIS